MTDLTKELLRALADEKTIQCNYGGKTGWCDLSFGDALYYIRNPKDMPLRVKP